MLTTMDMTERERERERERLYSVSRKAVSTSHHKNFTMYNKKTANREYTIKKSNKRDKISCNI